MTREGGRRRERRTAGGLKQLPWRNYRNPYKPIEVLSADHVEAIHETSLRILEEHGVEFLDGEALALLKDAGADVKPGDGVVRFDRGLIMENVGKAPAEVTLHARNPERNLTFGGNHINFGTVASAPNVSDLDRGRRPGNYQDYCDLLRLAQSLNIVQFLSGYPVEPADLPAPTRHLDAHYAAITLTDRIWHPYSLGKQRISDAIGMIRIARGFISEEQLQREPSLFSIVNSNSPRRLDGPMIRGLLEMSRHGQPIVLTPFTLSGAMAPSTVAGALALQNAEALAGIALIQIAAPGCPCMYG
ncbi:MAG: trimethylamine methyltransferase family protein, partial [Dongiaceae bacterium]